MINYFYPDMGKSVVDVLTENDIEIAIPADQACCGIPASVNGDVDSAKEQAKRNLRAFEESGADALLIACSSCGSAWKHSFSELMEGDAYYKELADKWAAKTYDINEFLVNVVPFKRDGLGEVKRTVTYHDPCHLNRGQNINKNLDVAAGWQDHSLWFTLNCQERFLIRRLQILLLLQLTP